MAGFSENDRLTIMLRNDGWCEVCAERRATQAHHRKPRGMGGVSRAASTDVNRVSNGIACCDHCHHWIENNRDEAYEAGHLVKREADPAETAALLCTWIGRYLWLILRDDGTYGLSEEHVSKNEA